MKRFTLLAAAGLFSMSLSAQEAKKEPKEEGFVFTTVKRNFLLLLLRTKTVQELAGATQVWPFGIRITPYGRKENTTCPKCTSYIKLILTVPMQQCALMEMYLSHKEVLSMM